MSARFRLLQKQFERLDEHLRQQLTLRRGRPFEQKSRDIARAVIVEGRPLPDVAAEMAVTKQRVSEVVQRYYQAYIEMGQATGETPVLWLGYAFDLPSNLVAPLEEFLDKAKRCKDPARVEKSVNAVIKVIESQTNKLD